MTANMTYAVIEMATGRIVTSGTCQREAAQSLLRDRDPAQYAAVETTQRVAYNKHWFNAGAFEELGELSANWDKTTITADGSDTATLSGLPLPCEVTVDGDSYEVADGILELVVDQPGNYYVEVDHPAYFRQGWIIDAN